MYSWIHPPYLQKLLDGLKILYIRLRSSDAIRLNLSRYNVNFYGLTCFSVCGPKLLKELSSELRAIDSILSIFKTKLKTQLFKGIF